MAIWFMRDQEETGGMNIEQLKETLKVDEGVVYEIYKDHLGYPTFGIGHLVLETDPEYGWEVGDPVSEERVDECFEKGTSDPDSRIVVPESNRITGNIGIEYLIFKYRLNIYAEYFQKIEHNLLGTSDSDLKDIKDVYSHAQALSQCSNFIKNNNLTEHVRADTAGSAEMISRIKDIKNAAIASTLSAETYGLEIIKKNIENEKGNLTRFLIMGKNISQPEFGNKKYITSFLFKLKSKPAALYQSLGGFAINGVNLTKLQSYPEKNTFDSFFFLCDLDGHIEDIKVQKSLEELGLHCQDFHVLGVFEADKIRGK